MKLKPDNNWRWYFDSDHDRMMLDLANDMIFRSRLAGKVLTPDAFTSSSFSLEDTARYFDLNECCRLLPLNAGQRAELLLNALAAYRFLKPQMPKSWYFTTYYPAISTRMGDIVQVQVMNEETEALLLVIEAGSGASLCLLAQSELQLCDRTLYLGDTLKVMNDRLRSVCFITPSEDKTNFSQAV